MTHANDKVQPRPNLGAGHDPAMLFRFYWKVSTLRISVNLNMDYFFVSYLSF